MSSLTGALELVRLTLRRDRIRIAVWVAAIVALQLAAVSGIKGFFPTQASLDQMAAATEHNAAAIAFNGAPQGLNSVGGEVAFNVGAFSMVLVALMSLLMIGRLTRGEEEGGRVELIRSLPVGTHAPTLAALIVVAAMNVAVGVATTFVLLAENLPAWGSAVFGVSFVLVGLVFAGVALVAAQVTDNTRLVYGGAGAVLGAAFVVRALGDIGDGTASWFSPIGIAQKTRPFAGERWWPFLILLALAAALVFAAGVLAARRDLGAGLIAARPGPAAASPALGRPLGFALRLQRGTLVGWGIGAVATAVAYGSIGPTVDSFVGQNKAIAQLMAQATGASLIDSYFSTSFKVMALVAAGFAIQASLRLRAEESAQHAESLLATPVSRWRWSASHLLVAWAGSALLLFAAGLTTGLSYGLAGGDMARLPGLTGDALAYTPAPWLMAGLAAMLFGLVPRMSGAAWAVLGACYVVALLGEAIKIPAWVIDLSPFERVPALPAAHFTAAPLVAITALALGFTAVGLTAFRRRDVR